MAVRRKILDDLFDAFTITAGTNYVSLYDAVGQMTRYSAASVELFGLPGEYIPDGSDNWADYVHPEDRSRYVSIMGELLSGTAQSYNLTYRVRMKNGDYGLFRFIGAILRNEETNVPELVGGIMKNEALMENTDSITVLRNQYGFMTDLETILEMKRSNVIVLMGVTAMSEINEKYGYGYGNHVLQQIGWTIQESFGQYGTVYRLEGAKFALITDQLSKQQIEEIYENMRQRLLGGVDVDHVRLTLVMNGGVMTTAERRLVSAQSILSCLVAVYMESKRKRHGRLVDFDRNDNAGEQGRLQMIDTIRDCIIHDCRGFTMHYQPCFLTQEKKPFGAEALLRFHHEDYGELPPSEYIPVLERDYIFEELGYWILERSMRESMVFIEKNPDFLLGVNVASVQLEDEYFVEELHSAAQEVGFPLKNLCLELTKECRQLDKDLLVRVVGELRELGVGIVLDDFGSGMGSIDFLRDLQPDYIKYDMRYVRDIAHNAEDQQIVRHMSQLAVACGTQVCIKGVEGQEIYDVVRDCGVHAVQGQMLGDALPAGELLLRFW